VNPAGWSDLRDLVPVDRPKILAVLPETQARERCKFFLLLEGVGWNVQSAWDAAMSLDPLLIMEIKHVAGLVPDQAIRRAVLARRTLEPGAPMLAFCEAELDGYLKPSSSRIAITVGDRR
jgi:hypothetical protein